MGHFNKNIISVQNTLIQIKTITKRLKSIMIESENEEFRSANSQLREIFVGNRNLLLIEIFVDEFQGFGRKVGEDESGSLTDEVFCFFPVNHSLETNAGSKKGFSERGFAGSGIAVEDQDFGSTGFVGCLS